MCNEIDEPKYITPVKPVKTNKNVSGPELLEIQGNKLKHIADDTKRNFENSKFKIGDRIFVVMMVEDANLIKDEHLGENDQFLFEVKRNQSSLSDSYGDWKFSKVLVTAAYFEDEADGYYFNGIAEIGNEKTKAHKERLFCVKRIDKDGNPVYNLAKYNFKHKSLMAGCYTSSKPITFEEDELICPLFDKNGQCYAGINTYGEKTPAPFKIVNLDREIK